MTKQELDNALSVLSKKYESDKRKLLTLYAQSNEPQKVGDIIECKYDGEKIKIAEIEYSFTRYNTVETMYVGKRILANGKESKKDSQMRPHQIK